MGEVPRGESQSNEQLELHPSSFAFSDDLTSRTNFAGI